LLNREVCIIATEIGAQPLNMSLSALFLRFEDGSDGLGDILPQD
jgi:hypothetical protein